jgi:hypothetical protein
MILVASAVVLTASSTVMCRLRRRSTPSPRAAWCVGDALVHCVENAELVPLVFQVRRFTQLRKENRS